MRLSVIVATRNRAHALTRCSDSIAVAIARAAPVEAEIVVIDNGSTDNTAEIIKAWTSANAVPVQSLHEPIPGLSRAHNLAVRHALGTLFAITDDDCRLHPDYVNDLLRYDAADSEPVLRGGRIELGDPTDLPLTIKTTPDVIRWSRRMNSARHQPIAGEINGCNMTMRRAMVEKLGGFDERFGPGGIIGSGGDSDFLFRAYLADFSLEYVPDMAVTHHHGRLTKDVGNKLLRGYMVANGALAAKYLFKHPNLARPLYWDCKNALREIFTGTNTFLPAIGFSHKDKVSSAARGALRYLFLRAARQGP